ncbi:MAG TPA: hypothetical protein VGO50_06380 [Pyrinomonadaceae bacterium]|nr:hypothetical protein [Pyrinomonadaceae bacterium]
MPFSTKEPAVYQAELVISFPAPNAEAPNAEAAENSLTEQIYFIAKDGETRRIDYELSEKDTLSVLEKPDGKTLVLLPQKKCSVEETGQPAGSQPGDSLRESLTTGWLAEKIPSNFTALGKVEVNGKMLDKYQVRFEKRGSVESQSEAIVWVDAELGMPVRTELYTVKNDRQLNKVITELRNLKLSVDAGVFDPPPGCQNIPAKEMQKLLRQERSNSE